jgi:hypothetical protein
MATPFDKSETDPANAAELEEPEDQEEQQAPEDSKEGADDEPLTKAEAKELEKQLQKGFRKQAKAQKALDRQAEELDGLRQQVQSQSQATAPVSEEANKLLAQMEPEYREAFREAVRQEAKTIVDSEVGPIKAGEQAKQVQRIEQATNEFFEANPDLDEDDVWAEVTKFYPVTDDTGRRLPPPSASQLTAVFDVAKSRLEAEDATNLEDKIRAKVLEELAEKSGGSVTEVKKAGSVASSSDEEPDALDLLSDMPIAEMREKLIPFG